jgi:hypothetical protein
LAGPVSNEHPPPGGVPGNSCPSERFRSQSVNG